MENPKWFLTKLFSPKESVFIKRDWPPLNWH